MNSFISILFWCLILELLAIGAAPLVRLALPNFPDRGAGLAKTAGILVFGSSIWLLNLAGVIESTKLTVRILLVLFVYGGLYCSIYKQHFKFSIRSFLSNSALFYAVFFLFLFMRSLQPEIFWGEKPMDFTFLNFFIRLDRLPPEDPWAAGHQMSYYYLGTYFFALLHKLSGVLSPVGYNLAISTLPALLAVNLYSLLLALTKRRFFALFGTLAATLFGNLEVLRLVIFKPPPARPIGFDLSWASTRLYTSPAFNEHPLWSFSFADLHAHVIAYPFAALILALAYGLIPKENESDSPASQLPLFILLGIALGSLVGINMWDALILCPIVGLIFLRFQLNTWRKVAHILICAATALIFALPFILSTLKRPNSVGWGYVTTPEYNSTFSVLLMFGIFFLPIFLVGIRGLFLNTRLAKVTALAITSSTLLTIALMFSQRQVAPLPLGSLAFFASLLFITISTAFIRELSFPFFLAAFSTVILIAAEFFFLLDRMNTIFKFYTATWVPFCIAMTCGLCFLWTTSKKPIYRGFVAAFMTLIAITGFTSGAICAYGLTTVHHVQGPKYTLNGTTYREAANRDEAQVINWINKNVKGTPTILESYGISYGPYTRISMNTGLPTVIGWEHHIGQRGVLREDIIRRQTSVSEIYKSTSKEQALTLLKQYNVTLIIIADLERTAYGPAAGDIFKNNPDQFQILFSAGNTVLYLVK